METANETRFGCQNMTSPLRRVLVRAPRREDVAAWRAYGWRSEPDFGRLEAEHEVFRAKLAEAGAEVVLGETPLPACPDAIYTYDPALISNRGAVLLRPGKEGRRIEVDAMAADLVEAGVPIAARIEAPATVEGGDTLWLDEDTLLVGRGYRTNDEGIEALRKALPDTEVISFDLPHWHGRNVVMHLMSFYSPLDVDLAVVHLPVMPSRLVEILEARGVQLVEVPPEEFDSMGPNVLALAPRVALALDGNDITRKRMEAAGVEVRTYGGDEISRKGDGGPTCLTRPLLRG